MKTIQNIILATFLTGLLPFFTAAQSPAPCPSDSTFGCFEVGLPGSSELAAGKSIDTFIGGKDSKPILKFIGVAVNVVIAALVIIGVISIVIGGYMYMTAGGDGGRVKMAKEMIVAALVGILLSLISVVILNTINKYLGSEAVEPELGNTGTGTGGAGGTSGTGTGGGAGNNAGAGNNTNIENSGSNLLPNSPVGNKTSGALVDERGYIVPPGLEIMPDDVVLINNTEVIFRGKTYELGPLVDRENMASSANFTNFGPLESSLREAGFDSSTNNVRILRGSNSDFNAKARLQISLTQHLGVPAGSVTIPGQLLQQNR